jgi:drug/metabolite transporter (DMT)-like permease
LLGFYDILTLLGENKMNKQELKSNILLLLAAAIWGFAFVAQRIGAQYVGSFTFNGVRFALGCLSLLPLILYFSVKNKKNEEETKYENSFANAFVPGIIAGFVIFAGASLQQMGIVETTAGKAAFITGFYIVLVPVFGIFLKHRTHITTWLGVALAIIGLYLLSVTGSFSISRGDLLEIIAAIFWASHILVIDYFTKKIDALKLSFIQFATCSILSLAFALVFEKITIASLSQALIPIIYGGIFSVGVAYTLQVVGQKHAKPSHAAIVLSMETVFASIGGILILNENY